MERICAEPREERRAFAAKSPKCVGRTAQFGKWAGAVDASGG